MPDLRLPSQPHSVTPIDRYRILWFITKYIFVQIASKSIHILYLKAMTIVVSKYQHYPLTCTGDTVLK